MRRTSCFLWKLNYSPNCLLATKPGKCFRMRRFYATRSVLEELEENGAGNSEMQQNSMPWVSLAKSLACLTEHSAPEQYNPDMQRNLTRAEHKRLIELRIKKRVKSQYLNGKFYDLMDNVIAKYDTLQDSYDIIQLNSNIELGSDRDDICFKSMAELLVSRYFDIVANSLEINLKSGTGESLVLPKLKLRIVQEAMRVVLEVIYRPHFSKISHGCRSGRGLMCGNQMAAREYKPYDTMSYDSILGSTRSNRLLKTSLQIELLESKIVTQAAEKETLLIKNRKLDATNNAMRKDLAANMKEVQGNKIHIGSINIESDIQVRSLMKKITKIEDDIREEANLKKELQQAHAEVRHLINKRMELNDEIGMLTEKTENGNRIVQLLPQLIVERHGLKEVYKNICATFEHNKKSNTEDVEHLYAMEEKLIAMASESKKLQAGIYNAMKGRIAMQPCQF